jgi:hypothetical protein
MLGIAVSQYPVSPTAEKLAPKAPVAQLDRALDFESRGREFESLRARQRTILRGRCILGSSRPGGASQRDMTAMRKTISLAWLSQP